MDHAKMRSTASAGSSLGVNTPLFKYACSSGTSLTFGTRSYPVMPAKASDLRRAHCPWIPAFPTGQACGPKAHGARKRENRNHLFESYH
jgi:hypothetical protein